MACGQAANEPEYAPRRVAELLLELQTHIHPALYRSGWATDLPAVVEPVFQPPPEPEPSPPPVSLQLSLKRAGRSGYRVLVGLHVTPVAGATEDDGEAGAAAEGGEGGGGGGVDEPTKRASEEEGEEEGEEEEEEDDDEMEQRPPSRAAKRVKLDDAPPQEARAAGERGRKVAVAPMPTAAVERKLRSRDGTPASSVKGAGARAGAKAAAAPAGGRKGAGPTRKGGGGGGAKGGAPRSGKGAPTPPAAALSESESEGEEAEEAGAGAGATGGGAEAACEICASTEDESNTLLCDGCDKCFHIYCLPRPMIEVPEGDWYCLACSDAKAKEAGLPYRVGCELRCRDEEGNWSTAIMEAMGPDGVLVHHLVRLRGAAADKEWVSVDSGRLQFVGSLRPVPEGDEMEEDDDDLCWVCGSADDSEHLLLCDTEGCDSAYHTDCLRTPLAVVPEGEWFCELCEERRAVGGALDEARTVLPDCAARWQERVRGIRCSAQLSLAVGTLEAALRLDDLSVACARSRKAQRNSLEDPTGSTVADRRAGPHGFFEFLVDELAPNVPATCTIVIPESFEAGKQQKISFYPPGGCKQVTLQVPDGMVAGHKITVNVPLTVRPRVLVTSQRICEGHRHLVNCAPNA